MTRKNLYSLPATWSASIPSYAPESGNTEAKVVEFLAGWIRRELDLEPLVEEVEPGRENIIIDIDSGHPGPVLMFEGHTDVVSEGERSGWKHDPFAAVMEEGRIYGRGSCDMKAGLAVNLVVTKALLSSKEGFRGKIRHGIVCDEEGMMIGIKDFINRGHADDVDACLVCEPEENQLCLSMKGAIRALVRVNGRMAHGAMPLTGINPNTRMARIITAFEEFETAEKERCGKDSLSRTSFRHLHGSAVSPGGRTVPAQRHALPVHRVRGHQDRREAGPRYYPWPA